MNHQSDAYDKFEEISVLVKQTAMEKKAASEGPAK
jgi:hypothetical protein